MKRCLCCMLLLITTALVDVRQSRGQGIYIIVGQAGVNPGAGLFLVAENEGLYRKHGLDVEIIKTNTTAAVQAMLAGKMGIATGVGAAPFVTAQLEGILPVSPHRLLGKCFPLQDYGSQEHQKNRRIEG